ncbi:alpha/beta fold hydrolase [Pseudorhodoferax sp.]|uniref:alpha/beta fold hydrolase n=1 Tax=Pseudorhodoferax sp. TaxID=1993553 RepID=UPI002DD6412C|nr:alpha/beta hydrolase [Pseudorhodoferax sp.]
MRKLFKPERIAAAVAPWLAAVGVALLLGHTDAARAQGGPAPGKPVVVLVHGAFAESSSWDGVTTRLQQQGHRVVAVANPLRGVESDAGYVRDLLKSLPGPVVLVGHSYGGSVISNASSGSSQVKALVFVAAFAPEAGESAAELSGRFPGSTLGPTLAAPVALSTGGKDLYIEASRFHSQFAADVPAAQAALMAAAQRPIAEAALGERAGPPGWKQIPSWFVYGSADRNIPPAALRFMAERAAARKTVAVDGASHVVMASQPQVVADLIAEAAAAP